MLYRPTVAAIPANGLSTQILATAEAWCLLVGLDLDRRNKPLDHLQPAAAFVVLASRWSPASPISDSTTRCQRLVAPGSRSVKTRLRARSRWPPPRGGEHELGSWWVGHASGLEPRSERTAKRREARRIGRRASSETCPSWRWDSHSTDGETARCLTDHRSGLRLLPARVPLRAS